MSSSSSVLRWQWTLANGAGIEAVLDSAAGTETVLQGSVVLSESTRGGKPDGHTVIATPNRGKASDRPPIEAVVTFEPYSPICVLRVDNHEVTPVSWPLRKKGPASPTPPRPTGLYMGVGAILLLITALGIFLMVRSKGDPTPPPNAKLDGTYRAPSGLFIAHHPTDLEPPRVAIMPTGVSGIILEDKARSRTIVIAAMLLEPSTPRDPWLLQQRLHDEALVNVPRADGKYEETSRRDDTCIGERGSVIVGTVTKSGGQRARVWSCAFVHDVAAYIVMYMLVEPTTGVEERRVRAIVDATELTHLADLGPDLALPTPEKR